MGRITGIGGVFFRARDPEALGRWYAEVLGVPEPPASYESEVWRQEAGPTIWAAFPVDADAPIPSGRQWGINFRVRDLDALVERLRLAGVDVAVDPEVYPNGRFAGAADPEGNPIQLWEPNDAALRDPAR
jgi:glyoxylase I family protein